MASVSLYRLPTRQNNSPWWINPPAAAVASAQAGCAMHRFVLDFIAEEVLGRL